MSKFKIAKQIVNNNENCRNGCGFGCLIYFLSGAISSLICFIIEHINLSTNVVLCLEYIISALVWIIIILSIMIYSKFKLFKELHLTFCYEKSEWYQQTKADLSELLDKGVYGEYLVFKKLSKRFKKLDENAKVYTSVIIPLGNDNFAEIDMLIVSKFGIHVCEVKNRVGTITGNIRDKTLSVQAGNEVYEMENPFYQNSIHMNYIRTLLYNHLDNSDFIVKKLYDNSFCNTIIHNDSLVFQNNFYNGGLYENWANLSFSNINKYTHSGIYLTKDEQEEISKVIERLPQYTYAQKQAKIKIREQKYNNGEFKENNNYTIGYFSFNNCQQHLYTIEKSNDTITTYYCPFDGWFRTFPDAECNKVCRRTMRFDQSFDYYRKSIRKNG